MQPEAESGYCFYEIVIRPKLTIAFSDERESALDFLKKDWKLRLVSRAILTPLKFEPQVDIAEALSVV